MTTRPASPQPVARWPFVLGDLLCIAVAATVLLAREGPPGATEVIVFATSIAGAIALLIVPYILDQEMRVRIAEAQARDHGETQLRRLAQTTEQLANAVSRSQSTEEQAGQALGTIEELSEKLSAQAEELAQTLARSQEREVTALKKEIERLAHERDDRLAALDQRLDTVTGQISEHQLAARKSAAAAQKTLEDLRERVTKLASRLQEVSRGAPTIATRAAEPSAAATPAITPASHPPPATGSVAVPAGAALAAKPASKSSPSAEPRSGDAEEAPKGGSKPSATATQNEISEPAPGAAMAASPMAPAAPTGPAPSKPRPRRAPEPATATGVATATAPAASRIPVKHEPLDLPLDLGETRPIVSRESRGNGGPTSTLVATAYIGIGNKLYVRGDGPGLSWNQGVPMQFLAIGKWGWTSPEAAEPITCRIYRNDDTPMLDENIVIAPGAKAEVTPRF